MFLLSKVSCFVYLIAYYFLEGECRSGNSFFRKTSYFCFPFTSLNEGLEQLISVYLLSLQSRPLCRVGLFAEGLSSALEEWVKGCLHRKESDYLASNPSSCQSNELFTPREIKPISEVLSSLEMQFYFFRGWPLSLCWAIYCCWLLCGYSVKPVIGALQKEHLPSLLQTSMDSLYSV